MKIAVSWRLHIEYKGKRFRLVVAVISARSILTHEFLKRESLRRFQSAKNVNHSWKISVFHDIFGLGSTRWLAEYVKANRYIVYNDFLHFVPFNCYHFENPRRFQSRIGHDAYSPQFYGSCSRLFSSGDELWQTFLASGWFASYCERKYVKST